MLEKQAFIQGPPEMICLVHMRNGEPMRYFPVGSKGTSLVPPAVAEDLSPESRIEVAVAAPEGPESLLLVAAGFMEVA